MTFTRAALGYCTSRTSRRSKLSVKVISIPNSLSVTEMFREAHSKRLVLTYSTLCVSSEIVQKSPYVTITLIYSE
jgi:hypothetical protein